TYSQGGAQVQGGGEESRPSALWRDQKQARQRLRSSRSRMLWQRLLCFWVVARHWLRLSASRMAWQREGWCFAVARQWLRLSASLMAWQREASAPARTGSRH